MRYHCATPAAHRIIRRSLPEVKCFCQDVPAVVGSPRCEEGRMGDPLELGIARAVRKARRAAAHPPEEGGMA